MVLLMVLFFLHLTRCYPILLGLFVDFARWSIVALAKSKIYNYLVSCLLGEYEID